MRYTIVQLLMDAFRYLSFIIIALFLALRKHMLPCPRNAHAFSKSYLHAIFSASVYGIMTTLPVNLFGALALRPTHPL
ncbi:hypothetical protein K523DRAFT_358125 [Schizophyllum commune Tattone D]|nr:hypothetical protein K523DRAFT_358125 [Schizophyllum commune Tattone D]